MSSELNKTILVVDDDDDIRQLLTLKLGRQGYQIIEASDGYIGLDKLNVEAPDMVMVDVHMPGMDGFKFCEQATSLSANRHIPIMIMTAQDDQESVNLAYEKGATDFITKPINLAKLNHRVRFSLRASETAKQLASRERQLLSAQKVARMGEWVYLIDKDEYQFSDEVKNIFGFNFNDKPSFEDLMTLVMDKDVDHVRQELNNPDGESGNSSVEFTIKTCIGETKRIRQVIDVSIDGLAKEGKLFGIFQDITDLREAEQKVRTLSFYDNLTGLPNRQFFKRLLKKAISSARRRERQFAVLDINLDKFMRINTNLGHKVGDRLLIAASERLNNTLRNGDELNIETDEIELSTGMLAHMGGDGFMILLNDIKNADDAAIVARRINSIFKEPFDIFGNEIYLTVSIGIGIYPDDGNKVDELIKGASTALHNAKETGRNCYRFYTEAMNVSSFQRLSLELSLRKAIERQQFQLYYQPKIHLKDNRICGAEALIRWNHPDLGVVSPADFIPIAESTGLIIPMTDWIIAEACRQLADWDKNGYQLDSVAINITPDFLLKKNVKQYVSEQLGHTNIAADRLDFEVTESVFMENVEVILPILRGFRDLGASVSIDDFGTGYSSLSYLKQLPISKLKIDQSFIHDVMHDNDDAIIVKAVISLAHSMGLRVIAEGAEDFEQISFLKGQNCDVVQGYYYSRPLPADEFYQWCLNYKADPEQLPKALAS